jgi:RNA polymerase sigma factor (sigma-70 family)
LLRVLTLVDWAAPAKGLDLPVETVRLASSVIAVTNQVLETRNTVKGMPTTRWSLIDAAGGDASNRQEALEYFARDYWPAVYAFIRCRGHSPHDAEDLTQSFLVLLIQRDSLATVTKSEIRFRSWLLSALKHFLINDWRDKGRLKRGGGVPHLSIDRDLGESWLESSAIDLSSPEAVFERRWAWGILERALGHLTEAYRRDGREKVVQILLPLVLGADTEKPYKEAAVELEVTHANARILAFRLRKHLRTLVREEIARTVGTCEDVEDELTHFFKVFAGA